MVKMANTANKVKIDETLPSLAQKLTRPHKKSVFIGDSCAKPAVQ
jgi:hypothetical protein